MQKKTLALRSLVAPTRSSLTPQLMHALNKHLGECIDSRLVREPTYDGRHPRSFLRYPPVEILEELPGNVYGFRCSACSAALRSNYSAAI